VTHDDGDAWHVPKGFLELALRARSGELRIAPELKTPTLKEELRDFARKVSDSARITYNARSGAHGGLILSICIALFIAPHRHRFQELRRLRPNDRARDVEPVHLARKPLPESALPGPLT
jgi:hypothetical protein